MFKKTLLATALLPVMLYANNNTLEQYQSTPSEATLDFLNINMPGGQPSMGLIGLHYDLNLLPIPDFYTGLGTYGAVKGNNGGFFALGIDNDYRPELYKSLYLDSGLFVGGGGARSAQVGGGLMILPHLGLGYKLGGQLFTLDYSYVTFPSGQISGSQVMLGVTFPSDFNFFSPGQDSETNSIVDWQADRFYLSPIVQAYKPKSGTMSLSGNSQDGVLGLVGAEGGKYITDRAYVALRSTAVAKGNANGYMTLMGGLGYQLPLTSNFFWVNDAFVGSGGGGNVDTGNGILVEADTGFGWQALPNIQPRIMIGYLDAPDGHFQTWVGTLGLNYDLGWLSVPANTGAISYTAPSQNIQHWRAEIYNQTFFDPERTDSRNGNINLIAASLDQQLTPNWFLSYRASFAYQGDNSGALATGMIGAGYQGNFNSNIHPHAEFLAGAAGGGGLAVGDGFLVEPAAGLRYDFSPQFGIDISGGEIISTSGTQHTPALNAGITYSFGKLVQIP